MEEALKNLTFGKAFAIGGALLIFYYFMMFDNGAGLELQIERVQGEIEKNNIELRIIKKAEEDAARYEEAMKTLGDDMAKVSRALPEELNSFDMLKIVTNEAKVTGLEIVRVAGTQSRSGQSPADAFYESIDVDAELAGQFGQVMLFLSNLTKQDKIITPQSMTITMSAAGGISGARAASAPRLSMSTKLTGYRYLRPTGDKK